MALDDTTVALALHPLCTLFPRLTGAEFDALKADILANGQREPIVVHEGLVLDGGNRYQACIDAGIEPLLKEFAGVDPVAYVLSANLHRRHLTPGQQAAIVASAQDWTRARGAGGDRKSDQTATLPLDSVADRAAQSGASERTQRMADKVAKASPELARQVAHGDISLPKALEQLAPRAPAAVAEDDHDDLCDQALQVVLKTRRASISLIQRHLRIGYNRAARLLEQMEKRGVVSPMQSNGNRDILAPTGVLAPVVDGSTVPAEEAPADDVVDLDPAVHGGDAAPTGGEDEPFDQLLADFHALRAVNAALEQRIAVLTGDDLAAQVDQLALKCAQFDSLAATRFNEIAELRAMVERQRSFLDGLRRAAGLPKGGDLAAWIKHAAQRAA
jgi:ParB-like chromosome segregation protein Spo0J